MPRECLPDHLKDKLHEDWPWPFSRIPRAWNAYCGLAPIWLGYPKPIPNPGTFTLVVFSKDDRLRPYFAKTWKLGKDGRAWHFRIGYRWDDVDMYYNYVVITLKRIKF